MEKLIATTALDLEASEIGLSVGNKELATKLGKQSRELILEKFNWDIVAKKFIAVAEKYIEN